MSELQLAAGGADAGLAERLDEEISTFNATASGHDDLHLVKQLT